MTAQGQCLCGAVRFSTDVQLRPVVACHCSQCRRQSGHFSAYTACPADELTIEAEGDALGWYQSSEEAKRGFCRRCGSALFWAPAHGRHISVSAGALDGPTGLTLDTHIFCADKGDYYAIPDEPGVKKLDRW